MVIPRQQSGLFRQAVGLDPLNAPANLNLAQAARARGDAKGARKLVRNALKQNGKNPDAYAVLARIYYDMGRFELSKLVCQSGLELKKQSPRLHNTLGLIYLKEDDQRRAIRSFASAIKADKTFVASRLNLGALALSYKDFKLAYSQFKQAVALDGKNEMAILSYGVAARSLGKIQEAEKQYKRVLSLNAKNIGAIYNLAVLESDYKKRISKPHKLFNDVVRLNPKDAQLRKRLANRIEVVKIQIKHSRK